MSRIHIVKKEKKMGGSAFTPALEGLKLVKSEQGELLTSPFLDVCKLILPILGFSFNFFFLLKTIFIS